MKTIKQRNNIFYLNGFDEVPDWVTESSSDGKKYFPLNTITRALFKRDLLPRCLSEEISISQEDKYYIRDFVHNPAHYDVPIIVPNGIELLQHQKEAMTFISRYNKFALFYGVGTGKTFIAISAITTYNPKSVLIVTPKAVISQYEKEVDKYIDKKKIAVAITNFESLSPLTLQPEMLIVDEAHKAKNFMSNANQALRCISSKAKYTYIFTGTPQDKSRHNILPQLAILDQRVMPVKGRIYERYFTINDYFEPDKEISTFSNELTAVIKAYSYGVQTDDVLNLPPENNIKLMCAHPPEYYDQLKENRVVKVEPDQGICVCENKATLRMKLREICAGFINTEKTIPDGFDYDIIDGEEIKIPKFKIIQQKVILKNTKIPKLKEAFETYRHCIVFTEFQEDVSNVQNTAVSAGLTVGLINKGSTKRIKEHNASTLDLFKRGIIDVLILNSKSGGAGLDLFQTNTIIFYTLPESFILFSQAKARIRRYGQTADKCNYVFLLCENSVEEQQYSALLKKKNFDNKTFKVYKRR